MMKKGNKRYYVISQLAFTYLVKDNNEDTGVMCEISSKLTKNKLEQRQWLCDIVWVT